MKKIICLVFSLLFAFVSATGTVSAAGGFHDVDETDWFYSGVVYAHGNGIMTGVTDASFMPNSEINRTLLITTLYIYTITQGYDVSVGEDTNILSYDDALNISEGAYEAYQWACGSGLIPEAAGAAKLGINDLITREQMVTLLYDFALLYGKDPTAGEDTNILSYDDVFNISQDKAYAAFQWACGSGIIVGTSHSTLSVASNATRAQLATVLMRLSAKR
ncbi:MAG: S-layer homology domain-containing protein [Syntrophomonadaceae bacterium]|nr:S-layer homology domain-containing protein [Syntrophomonadaceae bacterium]